MTSPAVPTSTDPGPQCPVCPHPVAAHDRIGLRYCAATAAQLARGAQTNPGCSCG